MVSSFSPKDEIWFLRVCQHISTGLYQHIHYLIIEYQASGNIHCAVLIAFTCKKQVQVTYFKIPA